MKKYKSIIANMLLGSAIFFYACDGDDNKDSVDPEIEISVEDFSTSIDENPLNNAVLGTVTASTNTGDLTFTLTNENPNAALNIDPANGALSVADSALFDFEMNPLIAATVVSTVKQAIDSAIITITLNDLQESSVGLITENADFAPRSDAEVVTFRDKIWIIGGTNTTTNSDEVWSSTDGITWTNVQATGQFGHFSPRRDHSVVVFNDAIWVIGGRNNTTRFSDVWSSNDGVN